MLWLWLLIASVSAAPKRKAPLVEENPADIDFINVVNLPVNLGIRFKYRGRTLILKFNHELHFPGVKKYWIAAFEHEEPLVEKNLSSCVYDVTKNHEFPQLLDEPNESSLLVFRCPHGCNRDDVGCRPSWDAVKIGVGVMLLLGVLLLLLCLRYHKARDKMKAAAFEAKVQAPMLQS